MTDAERYCVNCKWSKVATCSHDGYKEWHCHHPSLQSRSPVTGEVSSDFSLCEMMRKYNERIAYGWSVLYKRPPKDYCGPKGLLFETKESDAGYCGPYDDQYWDVRLHGETKETTEEGF